MSRAAQSASTSTWAQAARNGSQVRTSLSPGGGQAERLASALMSLGADCHAASGAAASPGSIYNTREPVQALANMESVTV
jgi:hypothetical protein